MTRPDAEQESPAGPGTVAKGVIRAIDACARALQRLRDRVAGTAGRESPDDRRGSASANREATEADAAAAPPPSLLRRLLIALILLIAGSATGALLSYRTLSHQLKSHAAVVERMQEEIDATRKEDARNVKLLDKFQRENAEYRHEAREAQRETDHAKTRIAELEKQVAEMKYADQARQQAVRAARPASRGKPGAPAKTGKCTAGNADDLAECIEKFNR